jgi:hypothetical protein
MKQLPENHALFLSEPFTLTEDHLAFYAKNHFIKLKQVLSPGTVNYFNEVISEEVALINRESRSLE